MGTCVSAHAIDRDIGESVSSDTSITTAPEFVSVSLTSIANKIASLSASFDGNNDHGQFNKFVRLIHYNNFVKCKEWPRYPDHQHHIKTFDEIDWISSVIVFVSHQWWHDSSIVEEGKELHDMKIKKSSDERHKPDNDALSSYKLCVEGIDQFKRKSASGFKDCYLWIDYSCLDQNLANPASKLKHFNKIMECCDCIFTPIVDDDHKQWMLSFPFENIYDEYRSPNWKEGDFAYLNRAWCRLEMFYGSNIPLLSRDEVATSMRTGKFSQEMQFYQQMGKRPHLLYGSRESYLKQPPLILPPIASSLFERYHPLQGQVHVPSDLRIIKKLTQAVQAMLVYLREEYTGEYNEANERHGQGRMQYINGDIYEGQWVDNLRHGTGVFVHNGGDVYEGGFLDDRFSGLGCHQLRSGTIFRGFFDSGKRHGQGECRFTDGSIHVGQYQKGVRHGRGTCRFSNGQTYAGYWENDRYSGPGVFKFSSGDVYMGQWAEHAKTKFGFYHSRRDGSTYEGEFKDDKFHGKGIYIGRNGNIYIGDFKNGTVDGYGARSYKNGNRYEGQFVDNKYHGQGRYSYANGYSYVGAYEHGKRCGQGVYIYANGDVYDGSWRDDCYEGTGTLTLASGSGGVFQGTFIAGLKSTGTFRYANGDVYEGSFLNDVHDGKGTYRYLDGAEYTGDWSKGYCTGRGIYQRNNDVYEGEFKDNMYHGAGKFIYSNGDVYVGEWQNNTYHGKGVLTYQNSDKYDGEYQFGKACGYGVYSYASGDRYEGEFLDDKFHGQGTYQYQKDGLQFEGAYMCGEIVAGRWMRTTAAAESSSTISLPVVSTKL